MKTPRREASGVGSTRGAVTPVRAGRSALASEAATSERAPTLTSIPQAVQNCDPDSTEVPQFLQFNLGSSAIYWVMAAMH